MKRAWLVLLFGLSLLAEDVRFVKGFDHFYNLEYAEALSEFSTTGSSGHPIV